MSRVSNRFFVEAIEDGSTLHGQLLSNHALTQAWTGSAAVPDWTQSANQPIIYVDLLSGNTKVSPDAGGKWYYNGTEITWVDSSATAVSTDGRFQKVANYPSSSNPTDAIKIIANLASSSNVDTDVIAFAGSYTIGGAPIDFRVATNIRITGITSNGIFGFIEFLNSNVVTEKNQVVKMYARLFSADGTEIVATGNGTPFSTTWKKDNTSIGNGASVSYGGNTYYNGKEVNESAITDNSVIECDFSYVVSIDGTSTTLEYKAFENIDDQTDYEQLYIQYDGANNTSATLKSGSITWKIWMGTQTDPTVDTSWDTFYVKLLNSNGGVVLDDISGIPNVVSDSPSSEYYGFRELTLDNENKAEVTITYNLVKSSLFNKYLTGIVLAEK